MLLNNSFSSRIIGQYTGNEGSGPLVLAFAATHGNEPAGVQALKEVFRMLEREPLVNPGFQFRGKLVGLIGNQKALATGQRYLEQDLNRLWQAENVRQILHKDPATRSPEEQEVSELLAIISDLLAEMRPETLFLLDLHTTSAQGGIFCIPTDDPDSLRLAKALHAPVVLGLLQGLGGTLLHFTAGNHFQTNGFPKKSVGVAFEGGQHEEPLSVSRCISATINCLRACGCVRAKDVDSRHDKILRTYSARLPKVTRIRHVHAIGPEDDFRMRPGYVNFQNIQKGEILADDVQGLIRAPEDGLILMPLYQKKGTDGYFLVQEERS